MNHRFPYLSAVLVGCLAWTALPTGARAYSVSTGAIDPCHEMFTGRAYKEVILDLPIETTGIPGDSTWKRVARVLLEEAEIDPDTVDDLKQFLLVSLVIGARSPDTDGHSLYNLDSLRQIHADPGRLGQYAHCLRGPDDDHALGNDLAVAGTRQVVRELVDEAFGFQGTSFSEQVSVEEIYLDFYGLVDLEVWAPFFLIGRAAHVVQDSFSHTIRLEQTDFKTIAHVMNYIDAISTGFDEERDGLAHSDTFDECLDPRFEALSQKAAQATIEFFLAVNDKANGRNDQAIEDFLDNWFTLEPGCTFENEMCDNAHWLELAREEPTIPYMQKLFGCSLTGAPGQKLGTTFIFVLLFVGALLFARRAIGRDPR